MTQKSTFTRLHPCRLTPRRQIRNPRRRGNRTRAGGPSHRCPDLNASVEAMMTLAAAETEDGSALMMAMKYSAMSGTLASDGNSMTAMNNAAMVLKARSNLMAAIEAAKTDKTEAEAAKAALPADADPALVQALDDAIMAADTGGR